MNIFEEYKNKILAIIKNAEKNKLLILPENLSSINVDSTAAGNVKLIGSSSDDTFTFHPTETLTADDTIDGNAGTDTIFVINDDQRAGVSGYGVGNDTAATFGANVTNVEKIVVTDTAADDKNALLFSPYINCAKNGISIAVPKIIRSMPIAKKTVLLLFIFEDGGYLNIFEIQHNKTLLYLYFTYEI